MSTNIVPSAADGRNSTGADFFDLIPRWLRRLARWVCWRFQHILGRDKPAKVPINPRTGGLARVDDPGSWGTFTDAYEFYLGSDVDGIGLVLTGEVEENGYAVGVLDVDRAFGEDGELLPEVERLVREFGTYCEISQSGIGLHLVFYVDVGYRPEWNRCGRFELYIQGRYIAMTERHHGDPKPVVYCQAQVERFQQEFGQSREKRKSITAASSRHDSVSWSDEEVLRRARRSKVNGGEFVSLFDHGSCSGFLNAEGEPDESARDHALLNHLYYWTSGDREQVRRLFASSACFRPGVKGKSYVDYSVDQFVAEDKPTYSQRPRAATAGVARAASASLVPKPLVVPAVKFYLDDEVDQFGPPVWHFEDHFERGALVVVVASSGTGKSLLISHWAWSISQGMPIFGKTVHRSKVIYLMSEGGRGGYKLRRDAWKYHHGVSKLTDFAVCLDSFDLSDTKGGERLATKVNAVFAEPPGLIVVDTMSCNAGGIDLDKNSEVLAFLGQVNVLRRLTGATVILVTHTGWMATRREFGAKSLRNSADTTILLEREQGSPRMKVSFLKQRNAASGQPYELECFAVLNSICLREPNASSPTPPPRIDDPLEPTFLEVLWGAYRAGRPTHKAAITAEVEDALEKTHGTRPKIHPRDARRILDLLVSKGLIRLPDDRSKKGQAKPYVPLKIFQNGSFGDPPE